RLILEGAGDSQSLDGYERHLAELKGQKELLESQLAQSIPELKLEQSFHTADADVVAGVIPPGHTLVEFIRFPLSFLPMTVQQLPSAAPHRYVAFVLPAAHSDRLEMVDLGDADDIDRCLADVRKGIGQVRVARDVATPSMLAAAEPDGDAAAAQLRTIIFDP